MKPLNTNLIKGMVNGNAKNTMSEVQQLVTRSSGVINEFGNVELRCASRVDISPEEMSVEHRHIVHCSTRERQRNGLRLRQRIDVDANHLFPLLAANKQIVANRIDAKSAETRRFRWSAIEFLCIAAVELRHHHLSIALINLRPEHQSTSWMKGQAAVRLATTAIQNILSLSLHHLAAEKSIQ